MPSVRCAVYPPGKMARALEDAVREGGGEVVPLEQAEAVIWADPQGPGDLRAILDEHPAIEWVQLPWAGIEPFVGILDDTHLWTCGKGVYAEPVAEHTLALLLALLRGVGHYAQQETWAPPVGRNLFRANVTVLGGGGITAALVRLLRPFDCAITVVRRHAEPWDEVSQVVPPHRLLDVLPGTDALVLAIALTPETERIIDATALAALPDHAVVVNVARGRHVDTDALVDALRAGRLGGAGLDVTDPEPLPDGHPLWHLPRVIITPHVGNTPEMGRMLLARRVADNVARYARGNELLGPVDTTLGY
jgi:phosphoglycerate dehydrogenase-like enzyme